jgi:hypothetical protein
MYVSKTKSDRVAVLIGDKRLDAHIVEDLGGVGMKGRHMVRVRFVGADEGQTVELPADRIVRIRKYTGAIRRLSLAGKKPLGPKIKKLRAKHLSR